MSALWLLTQNLLLAPSVSHLPLHHQLSKMQIILKFQVLSCHSNIILNNHSRLASGATCGSVANSRYCGQKLHVAKDQTVNIPICGKHFPYKNCSLPKELFSDCTAPFMIGVHTDSLLDTSSSKSPNRGMQKVSATVIFFWSNFFHFRFLPRLPTNSLLDESNRLPKKDEQQHVSLLFFISLHISLSQAKQQ